MIKCFSLSCWVLFLTSWPWANIGITLYTHGLHKAISITTHLMVISPKGELLRKFYFDEFLIAVLTKFMPLSLRAYISKNSTQHYMYLPVFIYFLSNLRNKGHSQRVVSCSNFCPLCDLKELINLSDVISIVGEMQSLSWFPRIFLKSSLHENTYSSSVIVYNAGQSSETVKPKVGHHQGCI